ncbi:MAG: ComF family protein, partial [Clostridia bacterium]|nr:ComF family protein [Clostridia bacterium]
MHKIWHKILRALKLLYTDEFNCISCDCELFERDGSGLCGKCASEIERIGEVRCVKCGRKLSNESQYCITCMNVSRAFDCAREPFVYDGVAKNIVHSLKFGGKRYLAPYMARHMADEYLNCDFNCEAVIPAPMHKKTLRQRGFNQAALLAFELADMLKLDYVDDAIVKCKPNLHQSALSGKEREENAKGVYGFGKGKDKLKGRNVLIVDDVLTTGAT